MSLSPCRSNPLHRAAAILILCIAAAPTVAGILPPPTILTVGNTGNCDHNTIEAAINAAPAAGNTIIRISNNVGHINQALSILNKNIELRGGYPGCDLAPGDPNARTTIRGNGGDSVVFVNAVGDARTVILRNLVIREGGSSDVMSERGGGLRMQGSTRVEVRNSLISDNESHEGAGIHISGSNAQLLLDNGTIIGAASGIAGNRAMENGAAVVRGGGIYCNAADIDIIDARIRGNSSESDGGGIYSNACVITITPRPDFVEGTNGANGFVTFFENSAGRNGGAIFAANGLITWLSAVPGGNFGGRATGNTAANSGGAFYLRGAAMQFAAVWVRLEANHAPNSGGAVHAQEDARFTLGGAQGMSCNYTTCPAIVDSNFETSNFTTSGGAVFAASGADVTLAQTVVARNQGFSGSAILALSEGTRITLRHVLVHQNLLTMLNNIDSPISIVSGADADLIHVTMAGNLRPGGILVQPPESSVLVSGMGSSADLFNSIFTDDAVATVRAFQDAVATASCVLSHENVSVPGLSVGDPAYLDPSGDPPRFNPTPASDSIDRCATAETFPMSPLPDLTGRTRPVDILFIPDDEGPWDMGAIEAAFQIKLISDIFADGFEAP